MCKALYYILKEVTVFIWNLIIATKYAKIKCFGDPRQGEINFQFGHREDFGGGSIGVQPRRIGRLRCATITCVINSLGGKLIISSETENSLQEASLQIQQMRF